MSYVTKDVIRELRERKRWTQKQLADTLLLSDKTISKWETGKGLPDIGVLTDLAAALDVSVAELLTGEVAMNQNRAANMRKTSFYVCPVCGNIIHATGEGSYSCCGILLPISEPETEDDEHTIRVEDVDGEFFVSMQHDMTKNHQISFLAYVSVNSLQLVKIYPEQNIEIRFKKSGRGFIYAYCNRHGLYKHIV